MASRGNNLTGEQVQQILDLFLYDALEPIVLHSSAFDVQIVYLLGLITRNRKRKLSSIPREEAINLLARALVTDNLYDKFELVRSAKIERNFIHLFVARYLDSAKDYTDLYNQYLVTAGAERKIIAQKLKVQAQGLKTKPRMLYLICQNSTIALQVFYEYRTKVIGNYAQLASKQAKNRVQHKASNGLDFKDLRQNILRGVMVGVDKYDSNKGALTSYINWWILNAQTCSSSDHEYGVAYTIPSSYKRRLVNDDKADTVNFSVSLDDLLSSEADDNSSLHNFIGDDTDIVRELSISHDNKIIQYITKCLDVKGIVRLSLDIDEFFSNKELKAMRKYMQHNMPDAVIPDEILKL